MVVAVKTGEKTEVDNGLKTVTNADDQFALVNEPVDIVTQVGLHLGGQKHARTMIITPAKAAPENQDMEVVQLGGRAQLFPHDQFVDVNAMGFGTGRFEGVIGLIIAVQSIARKDQSFHRHHTEPPRDLTAENAENAEKLFF